MNLKKSDVECPGGINYRSTMDALEALNGAWKLPILVSLSTGSKRFRQIAKDIDGISDKMLSKELKALEMNHLVNRTAYDTFPRTVEYSISEHANTLNDVVKSLSDWGKIHRKEIVGK